MLFHLGSRATKFLYPVLLQKRETNSSGFWTLRSLWCSRVLKRWMAICAEPSTLTSPSDYCSLILGIQGRQKGLHGWSVQQLWEESILGWARRKLWVSITNSFQALYLVKILLCFSDFTVLYRVQITQEALLAVMLTPATSLVTSLVSPGGMLAGYLLLF